MSVKLGKLFALCLLLVSITACMETPPVQVDLILRDVFSQESNRFVQGENIEFYLTITNPSDQAVTLNFSTVQQYDFTVTSSTGEVWRWSDDQVFAQATSSLVIAANSSIQLTETWDQTLAGGGTLPMGTYVAHGTLVEQNADDQYAFTIQ